MCGICGFTLSKDHPISSQDALSTMLKALAHRGPDDTGFFVNSEIALGAARLSIIDLAGGHQPIHNEDKTIWLTYNGEVYNFLELKDYLIKKGHIFYTRTDTEVIVHLYEEYGPDCLAKLNGMFAFAVWDKKKEELFLARDRFGIKPLYYCAYNGQFIFASEIKSILQFPGFKRELDLLALDQYLTFEYVPAPRSIFKKIWKLPAAHSLIYKNNAISISKYWDANFSKRYNYINEKEAEERLLQILRSAIKRHLVSDVPLGVFLSGGIDSSTIVALASNSSAGRIKTFSIGFQESSFDESRHAQEISDLYSTEHHHYLFGLKDLLQIFPVAMHYLDEPLADASFFPTYLLSNFARHDVTVALSGEGGDELFAGYPTYQAHRLARFYKYIPAVIRDNIITKLVNNLPVSVDNFSLDFKAKRFISSVCLPMPLRHIYWMGSFNSQDKARLYASVFKEALGQEDIRSALQPYFANKDIGCELDFLQYLDIKTYLQDDLLVKADRASMANSLEVRVPYLDQELAEFMFSLPPCLRLKNFTTKYIFKKTVKNILPQEITRKRKKGFGLPIASWIKNELKNLIMDALGKDKIKREGLFDYEYIGFILKEHFNGRADNRKKIWTLFMFEKWLTEYLDT